MLSTSVCPVVDSCDDLFPSRAFCGDESLFALRRALCVPPGTPASDARARGTTIHRHYIGGGLLPIFFSEFGLSRRPLVPNATHFSSLGICIAMLPCRTWCVLTLSAPIPGLARLSLISGLTRLTRRARLP